MTQKQRVGVIFGGQSGEHEVSLISAQGVMNALDPTKYEVVPIGITKAGQWLTGQQLLDAEQAHLLLADTNGSAKSHSLALDLPRTGPLDVVIPVLHGPFGEDGTIQGLLELLDVPYVGAGVVASAAAMDKAICKDVFRACLLYTSDAADD